MPQMKQARGSRLLLGAGIVGIAFTLRLIFASLSVRLPEVVRGVGISPWETSLLTMPPVLGLGLCALAAPPACRPLGR